MGSSGPPKVGFWRAIRDLGHYRLIDAVWPEAFFGVLVGVGGAVLAIQTTDAGQRIAVAGEALALAGVLLAVTFAALAFVVAIPSGDYLGALAETKDGGMRKFLDPFLVAVGSQVALVLLAIGYRLFSKSVEPWIEHVAFGATGFLLVFNVLDITGLARQLVKHGILRSYEAAIRKSEEDGGQVKKLQDRRG
jgi:hypothetical protein